MLDTALPFLMSGAGAFLTTSALINAFVTEFLCASSLNSCFIKHFDRWKDSPPHNELLLLDGASKIGSYYSFGIWDGEEGYYAVLVIN